MTMPRVADSINISPCPQHARNLHRSGPVPVRGRGGKAADVRALSWTVPGTAPTVPRQAHRSGRGTLTAVREMPADPVLGRWPSILLGGFAPGLRPDHAVGCGQPPLITGGVHAAAHPRR